MKNTMLEDQTKTQQIRQKDEMEGLHIIGEAG